MNELANKDLLTKFDECIDIVEAGLADRGDVLKVIAFKTELWNAVKRANSRMETACVAWLEKNGPIEEGVVRYYVGTDKTTKCIDPRETLARLLQKGGQDGVVACLSSSAFKPATAREYLGDEADGLFKIEERKTMETGKPARKLKKAMRGMDEATED